MKKYFMLFFLVVLLFTSVSCKRDDTKANTDGNNFIANTNPSFKMSGDDSKETDFLGVEVETDYTKIDAHTEYNQFKSDVKTINCTVIDNNPGKGFHIFLIPFIEKEQNSKWTRLNYQPPELQSMSGWGYCAIEGNNTKPNSTLITFEPKYLVDDFGSGQYRLVIFVGNQLVYAPFVIQQ